MKPDNNLDFQTIEEAAQSAPYQTRREMLESSKLSRIPSLPKSKSFNASSSAAVKPAIACVNCKVKLDDHNHQLKYAKVCRKCILTFTVIETELDSAEKQKRREQLERFIGGVK